ncbi:MAG: hypothetical protein Q9N68_01870 [Gammaproteobacteria bacterium]|nr:hypothetical protein [Gammaproteobacteria bacterium]
MDLIGRLMTYIGLFVTVFGFVIGFTVLFLYPDSWGVNILALTPYGMLLLFMGSMSSFLFGKSDDDDKH